MIKVELLQDESLGKKLLKKGFWLYVFTLIIGPSAYFTRIIISNNLSVFDVGVFYSVLSLIILFYTYNDLGFTQSLQYFLPKLWIKKKFANIKFILATTIAIQYITAIAIALVLFFSADWLAIHYFNAPHAALLLKILGGYFFIMNLFQIVCAIFAAFQDVFYQKLVDTIRASTIAIFSLGLFIFGVGDIFSYGLARVLGLLIAVIVGMIIFFKRYAKKIIHPGKIIFDTSLFKKYTTYALVTFLGINGLLLLGNIDQQMIIYFLGGEQAGYYTNFLSLQNIFWTIVGPLLTFVFPVITELFEKQKYDKIKILQDFLYKYVSFFALAFGGFLVAFGPEIATIFFGKKFMFSGSLLLYSGGFLVVGALFWLNFSILSGLGKNRSRVIPVLIAALVNIVLNYILIPRIGVIGGVISTIVGWAIMFVLFFLEINKHQKISFDRKFLLKNIGIISILVYLLYTIKGNIFVLQDAARYINLLYLCLLGTGFAGVLVVCNIREIKFFKHEIKNALGLEL